MNRTSLFMNARIYTPSGILEQGSLLVQNGRITSITNGSLLNIEGIQIDKTIDLEGRPLVPGFVDIHVHGGGGYDAMSGKVEEVKGMCIFHAQKGTTSILPTTVTSDKESTEQAIKSIVEAMEEGTQGAEVVGIHLEGPFLNAKRCGAQNPKHIRSGTTEELERFLALSKGNVRLMTLAPEEQGGLELIRYSVENGVTISIGHSDATYDVVKVAVENGASHITHLFNGMSPLHHREPGVAGAALMLDDLTVEMICDGYHINEKLIDYVFRVKPMEKIVLITDAVSAAGLKDGEGYELGGLPCYLKDGQVRLSSTDDLAGSALTMDQALRNVLKFTGKSLQEILPALTINPARQIGMDARKGSIEVGKDADLLILGENYELISTFVKGREVYSKNHTLN
jgi:N-acetylglucosamine-6-phosphate deacetylase